MATADFQDRLLPVNGWRRGSFTDADAAALLDGQQSGPLDPIYLELIDPLPAVTVRVKRAVVARWREVNGERPYILQVVANYSIVQQGRVFQVFCKSAIPPHVRWKNAVGT
jgi:hypothetical protein